MAVAAVTARPARYVLRSVVRARWRGYLGVALLLGLTGGVSLFAVAGARRTESAYPRFLRQVAASTMTFSSFGGYDARTDRQMAQLPEVRQSRTFVGFNVEVLRRGRPDLTQSFEADGTFNGSFFDQDRFTATDGRRADPERADEVMVNEYAAHQFGYRVGQHLELATYSTDQVQASDFATRPPAPKQRTSATIVGIGVLPDEVLQDDADRTPRLLLTPAFSQRVRAYATYALQGLVLRHGNADVAAVKQKLARVVPDGATDVQLSSLEVYHAQAAVRPLAVALGLFGVIFGVAALVLVFQALSRVVRLDRTTRARLRGLGASPGMILSTTLAAPLVAIALGCLLAIGIAVAASPLMPVGPVRRVEVANGVSLDATVLVLGATVMALLLGAAMAVVAARELPHRLARRRASRPVPSRLVTWASASGLSPAAVLGLQFALDPGDGAVPMRSVLIGAVLAVAALTGSLTFGASLQRLVAEPPLYGWNWNVAAVAANGYGNIPTPAARTILSRDPAVAAWSGAYFGSQSIDGHDTSLLGMDPNSPVLPPILHGRQLSHADEIVLGPGTASQLHKQIGDLVDFGSPPTARRLRVVGIATFPTIGVTHAAHTSLGFGALVTHRLVPGYDRNILGERAGDPGPRAMFIRFRSGTDGAAELAHLRTTMAPLGGLGGFDVLAVQRPAEIVNSGSVGLAPQWLAAAVAVGALISLVLAVGAAVRRRGRDLAVLRTLGFTSRQLGAVASWHSTTTAVIGLVFGLPLGVIIGQRLWTVFADQLDVVVSPALPLPALAVVALGALVVTNLVALGPARRARRVDAARLLRA